MNDERLTEVLPVTRVSKTLRDRLDRIVFTSVTKQMSDHIRFAVERYVAVEERVAHLPPLAEPDPEPDAVQALS